MKTMLRVLTVCGLVLIAVPGLISAVDLSRGIILDIPQEKVESQFGKIPPSQLTTQDSSAMASFRFTGDTLKVLAIMVEWSNRKGTYSRETYDSLLFSRNVFPGGSVADYCYEVSYGKLNVVGEVRNWYNAGIYLGYYNFENLFPILDPVIDYSQFDGNQDGDVDAVIFIRSGNGQEDSQDENDIWSYAMVYSPGSGPGPYDGKHMPRWNTSPETQPLHNPLYPPGFTGEDRLNKIRVFCHELMHNVGLPDLYDYDDKLVISTFNTPDDDNDHPLVDWDLMGYYGYGYLSIGSQIPSHLCGWNKKVAGWIEPVVVGGGVHNSVVIHNIETTKDSSLYMIPINPAEGEYFLLEYRNPRSSAKFDKIDSDFSCYLWPNLSFGGDTLDRGLLITHVHDSLGAYFWRINSGTPEYPHYTVAVEDAGYNPDRNASFNPEGHVTDSAQWWYPYETRKAAPFSSDVPYQNLFSPATYPSSNGYSGSTGIIVRVDSMVNDRLFAYIYAPIPSFTLVSPEDSIMLPYIVTFDWTEPYSGGQLRYDLYVSTSYAFNSDSTVVYDSLISSQFKDTLEIGRYYWKVRAYDNSIEKWSDQTWTLLSAMRGDANGDKKLSVSDVVYLINYLFKGGPPPVPESLIGNVNCDGSISVSDVVYLINYLFKGGPPPC
jgi:M6 family metalloprotease-like protein